MSSEVAIIGMMAFASRDKLKGCLFTFYIHMRNYKKAQICYEFRLPAKCEKNQQRFLLLINNAMQVWGSRMVEGEGVK